MQVWLGTAFEALSRSLSSDCSGPRSGCEIITSAGGLLLKELATFGGRRGKSVSCHSFSAAECVGLRGLLCGNCRSTSPNSVYLHKFRPHKPAVHSMDGARHFS